MLRGFFHPVRVESVKPTKIEKVEKQKSLVREPGSKPVRVAKVRGMSGAFDCSVCGLDKTCKSPKIGVYGEGRKGILIIGEAPSQIDDEQNAQFMGRGGVLLRSKLQDLGIDLYKDCWSISGVDCYPPDNRKPTNKELQCCWPRVEQVIKEKQPQFIWLMGPLALDTFYAYREIDHDKVVLTSWTRQCIADKKYNCWVLPQYHPDILVQNKDENLEAYFDLNLKWAVSCLYRERPTFVDWASMVVTLKEPKDIIDLLLRVIKAKPNKFVFDFETNSVKSYYPGTKVLSISFFFEGVAYSFLLDHCKNVWTIEEREQIVELLKTILEDPNIMKSAHGLKFEHKWSRKLGIHVNPWKSCTMTNQHILDSRDKLTGLKIQAFIRYGIEGYEREVKAYMTEDSKTHLNRLEEFDVGKLLLYGGADSLFEGWLDDDQDNEFRRMAGLTRARDFFHDAIFTTMKMEDNGIPVDMEYYDAEAKRLEDRRLELVTKLQNSPEAKKFEEVRGKPLSLGATGTGMTVDVKYLFLNIMGIQSSKQTAKGNVSVDDEVLGEVDNEFVKNFVEARKIKKVLEYIAQYRNQVVDGKLHPNFNLHLVKTYRSSSDSPNFQNIPKHDEMAMRAVRTGIIPSPGYMLMEADFASLEVRGNCIVSLDPELRRYLEDPTTDMHRDQAIELFLLHGMQIDWKDPYYKELRQAAKGPFVFALLYGDFAGSIAKNMWKNAQKDKRLMAHLKSKGISSYALWEKHVYDCEAKMWNKFRVLKDWRYRTNEGYRRRGYVESLFGFREVGYLRRNQLCNFPVQGACFHLLLWSAGEVIRWLEENNMKTKLIGQIHDSLVFDVWPDELDIVRETVYDIMCHKTVSTFSWINEVPLDAEFDLYGKHWADLIKE